MPSVRIFVYLKCELFNLNSYLIAKIAVCFLKLRQLKIISGELV